MIFNQDTTVEGSSTNFSRATTTQSGMNIDCILRFNRGTYDISGQKKYKAITFTPTDREIILKYRANIKYEFLDDNIQIKITDISNNETRSVYTSNEPQTVDISGYFGIDIPVKVEVINSENVKLIHEKKTIDPTEEIYQNKRVYIITDYYTVK